MSKVLYINGEALGYAPETSANNITYGDTNVAATLDSLSTAAYTGSYEDLTDTPDINDGTLTIKQGTTTLGTFTANQSGDTTITVTAGTIDIDSETPTFTAASTRANIVSGETITTLFGKIKKFFADLASVAFSGSYDDLSDTPTIPTVYDATLTIQKNGTTVNTFTANASSNVTANITVPTNNSELTNGAGYITSSGSCAYATSSGSATTLYNSSSLSISPGSKTTISALKQSVLLGYDEIRVLFITGDNVYGTATYTAAQISAVGSDFVYTTYEWLSSSYYSNIGLAFGTSYLTVGNYSGGTVTLTGLLVEGITR